MKRTSYQAPNGANRGFTLTELMIVITIMGLVLAVSTPAIMDYTRSWRMNGETSKVATIMRSARTTAVTRNINVIFVFDAGRGEYYTVEDTNGDGAASSGERKSPVHALPAGMTIDNYTMGQQWVTFGPKGNTGDGGTITLKGKNEAEKTIRVFSGTGNISVE
jgi:prepilin-type N-terminal cleavage/methylation domain-containing protein